jgi:predicted esterase
VACLDAVWERVVAGMPGGDVRLVALGFSQGVATACRWAALGTSSVDALILWAERVPPDLDLAAAAERLRRMRITLVAGAADPALPAGAPVEERDRLAGHGIPSEIVTFPGGHELDADTLRSLAEPA